MIPRMMPSVTEYLIPGSWVQSNAQTNAAAAPMTNPSTVLLGLALVCNGVFQMADPPQ